MDGAESEKMLRIDGLKLTRARIAKGLSLQDIVVKLNDGCNKSSVSRWEQGILNPSQERIEKLIEILGTKDFAYIRSEL